MMLSWRDCVYSAAPQIVARCELLSARRPLDRRQSPLRGLPALTVLHHGNPTDRVHMGRALGRIMRRRLPVPVLFGALSLLAACRGSSAPIAEHIVERTAPTMGSELR